MPEPYYFEAEMEEIRAERDATRAEIGRIQNLAHHAREQVDALITADGPDALWAMVCAGLGPEVIALDATLKAIEGR